MAPLSLSPADIRIIKRIIIISGIATVLIVAGTWTVNTVLIRQHTARQRTRNDPMRSPNVGPIDIEAHRLLAEQYLTNGTPEQAVPHLERIHALDPKNNTIIKKLAYALLEAGNYGRALDFYNALLERDSPEGSGPEECARRGIALFYLGRISESRSSLETCLSRFPRNAEALCFLGQIKASEDLSSKEALAYFNKSIEADSTYTEAWYQLARYYMELKLYAKARELLQTAIAVNPFHSKSYARLGMAYYYLEYPDLAKKSYQTALLLNPNDFNTLYNLAELQMSSFNDTVSALKNYKKALSLNPNLYEAAFKTGLICMRNNMYKEAIRYFEQALSVAPEDIRILLQYAAAFEKIDRKDKAAEVYAAILRIDDLQPIARQKIRLLAQEQPSAERRPPP